MRQGLMSVVVPAYNEAENIPVAAGEIGGILRGAGIEYEIIFVNDGSADNSWEIMRGLAKDDPHIRGVQLSRNFGKEGALFAGLKHARGGCAALIDCDLQHPPELLRDMYRAWSEEGFDVVEAVKSHRGKESPVYGFFAGAFYSIMKSAKIDIEGGSDYKLLDRKPLDELLAMPERLTFFRALSSWVGYEKKKIPFRVQPRARGSTKWNFFKLFKYGINNFTGFTSFPLHIITGMGAVFFVFSVAVGAHSLYTFFSKKALEGFTTVILLLLITGSFLMLALGIIGIYLEKIYEEIKFRPRYIVSKTTDEEPDGAGKE